MAAAEQMVGGPRLYDVGGGRRDKWSEVLVSKG